MNLSFSTFITQLNVNPIILSPLVIVTTQPTESKVPKSIITRLGCLPPFAAELLTVWISILGFSNCVAEWSLQENHRYFTTLKIKRTLTCFLFDFYLSHL